MKRQLYICLLTICAFTACKEESMMFYDTNDAEVYFTYERRGQADSVNYSFFILNESIRQDTVWVKLSLLGSPASQDRPISLVQTNAGEADAAQAGTHYEAFSSPGISRYMVMPSGETQARIPVVLYRTDDLKAGTKRLELAIQENDYFGTGIDGRNTFVITTTNRAVKPANWDRDWWMYFRTWGSEKMRFIIMCTGYTDWDTRLQFEGAQLGYWMVSVCKQKLLEYNAAHPDNPLREEDGTLVDFDS